MNITNDCIMQTIINTLSTNFSCIININNGNTPAIIINDEAYRVKIKNVQILKINKQLYNHTNISKTLYKAFKNVSFIQMLDRLNEDETNNPTSIQLDVDYEGEGLCFDIKAYKYNLGLL